MLETGAVSNEQNKRSREKRQSATRPHFFTDPWYKSGSKIEGKPENRTYVNSTATRARAGMLNVTAVSAMVVLILNDDSTFIRRRIAPMLLWEFVTSSIFGLTPISPYGVAATIITWKLPPVWKFALPKRFAWACASTMVSLCILFSFLGLTSMVRWVVAICIILTYMECSLDICCGCWLWNNYVAPIFGKEVCQECEVELPEHYNAGNNKAQFQNTATNSTGGTKLAEARQLVAMHKIVLFSKSSCRPCAKSKALLESIGLAYYAIEVDKCHDPLGFSAAMVELAGSRSFPSIFISGKYIGNLDDLRKLHETKKLTSLLQPPISAKLSPKASWKSSLASISQTSPFPNQAPISGPKVLPFDGQNDIIAGAPALQSRGSGGARQKYVVDSQQKYNVTELRPRRRSISECTSGSCSEVSGSHRKIPEYSLGDGEGQRGRGEGYVCY